MNIMSQMLHSYYRIDGLSSTASISYGHDEPRRTQIHTLNIIIILFICFNCVIPFRGYENALTKISMDATATKFTCIFGDRCAKKMKSGPCIWYRIYPVKYALLKFWKT